MLLLNPPSDGHYRAYLPTGLGYVAEHLRQSRVPHLVLDMDLGHGPDQVLSRMEAQSPAALAVGMMTYRYARTYKLLTALRRRAPEMAIIVGGPHVAAVGESVLRDCPAVDFAIRGEGERPLVALCRGDALSAIPGLIYRRGGAIVANPGGSPCQRLDGLGFPTYQGFELDRYPARIVTLVTTRGCPHGCSFCNVSVTMGRALRRRSAAHVAEEVAYWAERGVRRFSVADDTFTEDPEHAAAVCDAISGLGIDGLRFACGNGLRADRCDGALFQRLRRAGFDAVAFGVESASPSVLARLGKGQSLEAVDRAVRAATGAGMAVKLHFLVGAPGDSYEGFRRSLRFARRYTLSDLAFNNLIPYPGTALYRWVLAEGLLLVPAATYLDEIPYHGWEPVFETPEFSAHERRRALAEGRRASRQVRRRALEGQWSRLGLAAPVLARFFTFPPVERLARSWVPLKRCILRTGYRLGLR